VGSRVSLASIVHAYWNGDSPEAIVHSFPALSLEKVHGAIAFYLHHQEEIDRDFSRQEARWEQLRRESEATHEELLGRLRDHREGIGPREPAT
jgi:hypothetical protein